MNDYDGMDIDGNEDDVIDDDMNDEIDEEEYHDKSRKSKSLPTKDEQMHLQQIEILMKSNLVKLQVDEMLNEVRCDDDFKKNKLNKWIDEFCNYLKNASNYVEKSVKSKPLTKQWLQKNFNELKLQEYYQDSISIDFKDPKSVDVVGSSKLLTSTKPYVNVDIVINIPNDCFEDKDILNHAYFDKRKLYVAGIASALQHSSAADFIRHSNFAFFQLLNLILSSPF
jgi:hypothetical protein